MAAARRDWWHHQGGPFGMVLLAAIEHQMGQAALTRATPPPTPPHPNLISGLITTSPLATTELQTRTTIPILDPNHQPTKLTTLLTQPTPTTARI